MTTIQTIPDAIKALQTLRECFGDNADNATEVVSQMGCIAFMCDDPVYWDHVVQGVVDFLKSLEDKVTSVKVGGSE